MTRNTRLFSLTATIENQKKKIIYRELTVLELSFLKNINNDVERCNCAADFCITNEDPNNIPWPIKQQIGDHIINKSLEFAVDPELKEITNYVKDRINNFEKVKRKMLQRLGTLVSDIQKPGIKPKFKIKGTLKWNKELRKEILDKFPSCSDGGYD